MEKPRIIGGILGKDVERTIGQVGHDWSTVGFRRLDSGALGIGSRCTACMCGISLIVPDCKTKEEQDEAFERFDGMRLEHEKVCPAAGQADVFGSGTRN